jgi:hypothetical protein
MPHTQMGKESMSRCPMMKGWTKHRQVPTKNIKKN